MHRRRAAQVHDLGVERGERLELGSDEGATALLGERFGSPTIGIEDADDAYARGAERERMEETRDPRADDDRSQALAFSEASAAAMVASMSASSCALPKKAASYCDGGQY